MLTAFRAMWLLQSCSAAQYAPVGEHEGLLVAHRAHEVQRRRVLLVSLAAEACLSDNVSIRQASLMQIEAEL